MMKTCKQFFAKIRGFANEGDCFANTHEKAIMQRKGAGRQ